MNHIIVRETSAEIRSIARNALRDSWLKVTVGVIVYYVLSSTVPNLLNALIPGTVISYYNELLEQSIGFSYVSSLYELLLSGALSVGFSSFLLAFFRRKDINPGYVFNGFEVFFKSLALLVITSLFIFLWSLLFLIPGIVAALRYSQAFYILADDPSKSVMECFNGTKYYMSGNKGKLFCLNLSFIGWGILALLPALFLPLFSGVLGVFVDLVYAIPWFFFLTYMCTSQTVFYDLVSGNLVARSESEFDESGYHF